MLVHLILDLRIRLSLRAELCSLQTSFPLLPDRVPFRCNKRPICSRFPGPCTSHEHHAQRIAISMPAVHDDIMRKFLPRVQILALHHICSVANMSLAVPKIPQTLQTSLLAAMHIALFVFSPRIVLRIEQYTEPRTSIGSLCIRTRTCSLYSILRRTSCTCGTQTFLGSPICPRFLVLASNSFEAFTWTWLAVYLDTINMRCILSISVRQPGYLIIKILARITFPTFTLSTILLCIRQLLILFHRGSLLV